MDEGFIAAQSYWYGIALPLVSGYFIQF